LAALTITTHTQAQTPAAKGDVTAVLAAARAALGGDAKIAAVKTLVVTGRTRQIRGNNLVPIEFEIQSELPDKYSRRDEIPAQDSGPTTSGFSGDRLVQIPKPTTPLPDAAAAARVASVKQDFARLMLGLFASSYSSYPLTFTYIAQAEAPQGTADVVEVKGPSNFAARLFIHTQTHLPIMVSWEAKGPDGARGGPPDAARGRPLDAARDGAASAVEQRLYFADYREVEGLRLPFRIRRAVGPDTTEETTIDRIRINARIDPRRFEANE
jgi:hypothetical protein